MKSNYAKYLILFLGIAGLFTSCFTNAFWTWPDVSKWCRTGTFPNCSDYPYDSTSLYFGNAGSNYDDLNDMNYLVGNGNSNSYDSYSYTQGKYYTLMGTGNANVRVGNLKTYNDGDFLAWRVRKNNGTTFYGYVAFEYNFINSYKDGDAPIFAWWYDDGKKYNNVSYAYLPELPDMNGTGDYFYFNQPRHGTWIFYNYLYDIDLKTVQYIGNQVLTDKFIYVDTLANTDNVWLVDTNLNKAWSKTVTDVDVLSDYLFGRITFTDDVLNGIGRTDYYDIYINSGGNSFLPSTYGNFVSPAVNNSFNGVQGSKSFKGSNIGITYQKNYDFVNPNYGNSSTGNVVGTNPYHDYVQCKLDYDNVRYMANFEYLCRQDWQKNQLISSGYFNSLFTGLYYGNFNLIGNTQNCQSWVDFSNVVYTSLANSDLTGYQNYFLIADRNSWELNMLNVDTYCTYDVSGGSGTLAEKGEECSWWLILGDSLLDRGDCDKLGYHDFIDEVNETVGKWAYHLMSRPYTQIRDSFYSGYNSVINSVGNGNYICKNNISPIGKSYAFMEYVAYILLGIVFYILFTKL